MHIRPAEFSDSAAIAAVYAYWVKHTVVTFDLEAPSVAEWECRLADAAERGHPCLVGCEGGQDDHAVVGYASVSAWKPKLAYRWSVENSVHLAPSALGGGRGRALLWSATEGRRAVRPDPTATWANLVRRRSLVAGSQTTVTATVGRRVRSRTMGQRSRPR